VWVRKNLRRLCLFITAVSLVVIDSYNKVRKNDSKENIDTCLSQTFFFLVHMFLCSSYSGILFDGVPANERRILGTNRDGPPWWPRPNEQTGGS